MAFKQYSTVDPASNELWHQASASFRTVSAVSLSEDIYMASKHAPFFQGTTITASASLDIERAGGTVTNRKLFALSDISIAKTDGEGGVKTPLIVFQNNADVTYPPGEPRDYDNPEPATTWTGGYPATHSGVMQEQDSTTTSAGYTSGAYSGGSSGTGQWIDYDPDGDGQNSRFLMGILTFASGGGRPISQVYQQVADFASLHGTADDFARHTLIGAAGDATFYDSDLRRFINPNIEQIEVTGTFFHEDIYGGLNGDLITGGGGDDVITGGKGDDLIDGGDGHDAARYTGAFDEYLIVENADGTTNVTSARDEDAGTDVIENVEEFHFSDGVLTADGFFDHPTDTTTFDTSDSNKWESYTTAFDIYGEKTLRTTTFDDGRVRETEFSDGVRSSSTITDLDDLYDWWTHTVSFDANGDRTSRLTIEDDGLKTETLYSENAVSSITVSDVQDAFIWSTVMDTYAPDGTLVDRLKTFDDGRVLDFDFVNGTRATTSMTDANDAYAWESYVDTYDSNGERVSREKAFDDGSTTFISYADNEVL